MKGKKVLIILIFFFLISTFTYAQKFSPELIVKDIKATPKCEVLVTIANIGKGGVPLSYYNKISLQMYIDGETAGGMSLSFFDKNLVLTHPHTEFTKSWFPDDTKKIMGDLLPHEIKVAIKYYSKFKSDKVLKKTVTCGNIEINKLPDLTIKDIQIVKIENRCRLKVIIANIGDGGVPSKYYSKRRPFSLTFQMYIDGKGGGGIDIRMIDPKEVLKYPHSKVSYIWFEKNKNAYLSPGLHFIKLVADSTGILKETKKSNNTMIKKVFCKRGSIF